LIIQDISRDGRVLLKHTEWPSSMICLPPGSTKEVDLTWFDFSTGTDLSDDGKTLLFEEDGIAAGARGATYMRRTDGSPAVRLGEGYGTALSPDGKWAISIPNDMPGQLGLLPVGPGSSRMIETKGMECHLAKWFPDGKRILLNANEAGRPPRLYVLDVASGQLHSITPEGVEMGPVSPDGNFVAARGPGSTFSLYPVPGGQPRAIPGIEPGEQLLRWDADGKTLFLSSHNSPSSISIYRLDPATGRRVFWNKLGPTDSSGVVYIDDVLFTPDGKAYSYTYRRDLSYFYVVEGLN
jgi:eukaryotic-like serine/threonine-protein kinase